MSSEYYIPDQKKVKRRERLNTEAANTGPNTPQDMYLLFTHATSRTMWSLGYGADKSFGSLDNATQLQFIKNDLEFTVGKTNVVEIADILPQIEGWPGAEALSPAQGGSVTEQRSLVRDERELLDEAKAQEYILDLLTNTEQQTQYADIPHMLRGLEETRREMVNFFLQDRYHSALQNLRKRSRAVQPPAFRPGAGIIRTAETFLLDESTPEERLEQFALSGEPRAMIKFFSQKEPQSRVQRRLDILGYDTEQYRELLSNEYTKKQKEEAVKRRKKGGKATQKLGPKTYLSEARSIEDSIYIAAIRAKRAGTVFDPADPEQVRQAHLEIKIGRKNLQEVGKLIPEIEGFPTLNNAPQQRDG